MSAKTTVATLVVTPATAQASLDAQAYVVEQTSILTAAAMVAAAQIAAGEPQGAVVAALVPLIQAVVEAFPEELERSSIPAQAAFV